MRLLVVIPRLRFSVLAKGSCFAKFLKNEVLRRISQCFTANGKCNKEVEEGIAAMKILFNSKYEATCANCGIVVWLIKSLKREHLLNPRAYLPLKESTIATGYIYKFNNGKILKTPYDLKDGGGNNQTESYCLWQWT